MSRNRFFKPIKNFVLLFLLLLTATGVCQGKTSSFRDLHRQALSSGTGTMELRFEMLKEIASDPHNHVLLLGVSSDGKESYEIQIIQDKLIVHRRFGGCVLAAFVSSNSFQVGEWHSLKLTWNNESSRFYVDGQEVKPLGLFSSVDLPKMVAGIRLGLESNFKIDQFQASGQSDISVASEEDQAFVKNVVCTDLKQLIAGSPQEEYHGTAFRNFPGPEARDKMKAYLDLLPEGFAGAIKNVVFVEDARFLKGGEGGFADSESGSLVLKGSLYDDPTVFFHEAAHLYDFKLRINFGVGDAKSEWAAMSGASCYFQGANMKEYYEDFRKTSVQNGFLAPQGGQCASEDLAIWVGAVYERYLQHKTLADKLDPGSPKYSPKNSQKMDFILKKGFISQKIYDSVTR